MKSRAWIGRALLVAVVLFPFSVNSKDIEKPVTRGGDGPIVPRSIEQDYREAAQRSFYRAPGAADTTFLAFFDFEGGAGCDAQGWSSRDASWEPDYFHVDDFSGLAGGTFNRLWPIEGSQSLWCGMRPSTEEGLCLYASPPGYGNRWDQRFCTPVCVDVTGTVTVDYLIVWDTETDYDFAYLEYDECDNHWRDFDPMVAYTGVDTSFESHTLPDTLHGGQVRIRFRFISDQAWSDEDGIWNTDGAIIVDSVTVRDGTGIVVDTELFEDEALGATEADDWANCNKTPYGDFAILYPGATLVQEDHCNVNYSCMWTFLKDSAYDYSCGGFPGQKVIPYEDGNGQYIRNTVYSPVIPLSGAGNVVEAEIEHYGDLELNALIFQFYEVRGKVGDCWGPWTNNGYVYYTESGIPAWYTNVVSLGNLIPPGSSEIQVAFGVIDMCGYWGGYYGDCTCHSHSPMFDNISVYRVATFGPHISAERFGDGFPDNGTLTGTVRADNIYDVGSDDPPVLEYEDILWVGAEDPQGIAPDPHTGFGAAVYAYVSVRPHGQPGKSGLDIVDDTFRWPVVDSMVVDGDNWYQIRLDTLFFDPDNRQDAWPGYWAFDLNDNLFTPGDTIFYFYSAHSAQAPYVTYWTRRTGDTGDFDHAITNALEFTCLPATGYQNGGDILLCVDSGLSDEDEELVLDAVRFLGLENKVDRFDVAGASRLSGQVVDIFQQLIPCYRKIIWPIRRTMSDSDTKTDDYTLVSNFLEYIEGNGGVYFAGDHFAERLNANTSASAVMFRTGYMNFNLVSDDHNAAGLPISPLVVGAAGGPFTGSFGPDTLTAYGGCPNVNSFDVLAAAGTSEILASYEGDLSRGAIIGQKTTNSNDFQAGVIMSGFGLQYVRDDRPTGIPDRADHLRNVIEWLGNVVDQPTDAGPEAFYNSLSQNRPNPFNPVTTIAFTVREQGPVSLRVYNVAGQLVRTLVNEERAPGLVHKIDWKGRNNAGQQVSSGVYFYKLVAPGFTMTKKMVLLK